MRFLLVSQAYVPDTAAVGQHMHSAASALVKRGHRVRVLTSDRAYNDPSRRLPRRETRDGVEIERLALATSGKGGRSGLARRAIGGSAFVAHAGLRGAVGAKVDTIVVSTSPPMSGAAALAITAVTGASMVFWAMDLNPDMAIAAGLVSPTSPSAIALEALNGLTLRRARAVVALDRFMAERLEKKAPVRGKTVVIPPWAVNGFISGVPHAENPFRREHGLEQKRVVMYSGNHSAMTPLKTLLEAAGRLSHRRDLAFVFIGGGTGTHEIDDVLARHPTANILRLPYQPLERVRYSFSAADVHVVAVGDNEVGIRHPSKLYDAMAVGRPIFLLGPEQCHVADFIRSDAVGWRIAHGDVDGAVALLERIRTMPGEELEAVGERGRRMSEIRLRPETLISRFCEVVEGRALTVPTAP